MVDNDLFYNPVFRIPYHNEVNPVRIGLRSITCPESGSIQMFDFFLNFYPRALKIDRQDCSPGTVILTVNRPWFGTGLMTWLDALINPGQYNHDVVRGIGGTTVRVTSHHYCPSCSGISNCPVAQDWGYHRYPLVPFRAVLMRVSPLHAINGVGGIGFSHGERWRKCSTSAEIGDKR